MDKNLATTPGTDEWWVLRLAKELGRRQVRVDMLGKWMAGDATPPFADNQGEAFVRIQKLARLNLAELIVTSVVHRMQPLAFRTAADDDENGDREAARIMKANNFSVVATQAIEWMLTFGEAYTMQAARTSGPLKGRARITAEHPSQMIAEANPQDPREVAAALKVYRDDMTGEDVIVLRRPGYERVMRRPSKASILPRPTARSWNINPTAWPELTPPAKLATGTCGVSVYRTPTGLGEFEKHLDTLKRINHSIMQRMIIIALQAFRQRGVKGVPDTDENGQEIDYNDIFTADPGALWILPETAELWESGQADLTPVHNAVKQDIELLASASQTPMYTLFQDAANGSAEGAALQRETHLFKVEERIKWADYAFALTMSDAFAIEGDTLRSDVTQIDTKWMPAKRSSLTERAAAGVQAQQAGVPWRMRMEKFLELTPEEIAEAEQQRDDDLLREMTYATTDTAGANTDGDSGQQEAAA